MADILGKPSPRPSIDLSFAKLRQLVLDLLSILIRQLSLWQELMVKVLFVLLTAIYRAAGFSVGAFSPHSSVNERITLM